MGIQLRVAEITRTDSRIPAWLIQFAEVLTASEMFKQRCSDQCFLFRKIFDEFRLDPSHVTYVSCLKCLRECRLRMQNRGHNL